LISRFIKLTRETYHYLGRGDGALGRGADGVTEGRGEGTLGLGLDGDTEGRGEGALGRGADGVTEGRGEGTLGRGLGGDTEGRGEGALGRGADGVTEGRGETDGLGTVGRGLLGPTRLGTVPDGALEGNVGDVPGRLGSLEFPLTPPPIVTREGKLLEALGRGLTPLTPGVRGIEAVGLLTIRLVVPGAAVGTALATCGTRLPTSRTCR